MPDKKMGYDQGHYSTANFYTRSTDKRGHSHPIRIPDDLVAPFMEVVQDPRNPYRTWQDMVRDSLVHRLHQLKHDEELVDGMMSPATEGVLAEIRLEEQITQSQVLRHKKELLLEAVREGVQIDKEDVLLMSRGLTDRQQHEFGTWVKNTLIPEMDGSDVDG